MIYPYPCSWTKVPLVLLFFIHPLYLNLVFFWNQSSKWTIIADLIHISFDPNKQLPLLPKEAYMHYYTFLQAYLLFFLSFILSLSFTHHHRMNRPIQGLKSSSIRCFFYHSYEKFFYLKKQNFYHLQMRKKISYCHLA